VDRAVRASLALTAIALFLWTSPAASAQTSSVAMHLVRQSPWNTFEDPVLRISVDATNSGTSTLGDLSVELTIGAHYDSRLQYDSSLDEGPSSGFRTSHPCRGTLGSGATRTCRIRLDLSSTPGILQTDNLVYPARLDLRSGDTVVASLATPILYFVRQPIAPMNFTWWIELEPTIPFGPDGRLQDPFFPDSLATAGPGGQLGAPIGALGQALQAHPHERITTSLVMTPSLVQQAQDVADGFTRVDGAQVGEAEDGAASAAGFLATLKQVAAGHGVETVATPFSGPTLSSMLNSGLDQDLDDQRTLGMDILQNLSGVPVQTQVARPIDGKLSDGALDWLVGKGVTTILGNVDTVQRTDETSADTGEPAPTATLTAPDGRPLNLIMPDPWTENLLERQDLVADPVRAAQAILGELAVEWKEAPVPDEPNVRGRALALSSDLPPGLWAPLLERFRHTPFLQFQDPTLFAARMYPPGAAATLRAPDDATFSPTYTDGPNGIHALHARVEDYRSMLTEPSTAPDVLTRDLYYAESAAYVSDPIGGEAWLDAVGGATQAVFDSVRPQVGQAFTFTSGEGTIPLLMGDPGPIPLLVTVSLEGPQFEFPDGNQQIVTVSRPNQVVSFRVVAKATGQNPIFVRVLAPNEHPIGEAQQIAVRSTALNDIALIVTGAAAGVLALLYSRRWFRRTKPPS
jgi:Family of unknown function (DUF6049)